MTNEMEKGIDKLSAKINADYCKFVANTSLDDYDTQKERVRSFNSLLQFSVGKKYIKITTGTRSKGRSVWGFIVMEDTARAESLRTGDLFLKGDILKAASWAQPAKNYARGNILNGDYKVQWNGAC